MHQVALLVLEEVVGVDLGVVVAKALLGHQGPLCRWLQGQVEVCLPPVA